MFRILGLVLTVLGLYLVFTPIILYLKWIPLIGVLISAMATLAALFFSLIVGMTICFSVIGLAWIGFRPLLSFFLLALSSISISLIFFWDKIIEKIMM